MHFSKMQPGTTISIARKPKTQKLPQLSELSVAGWDPTNSSLLPSIRVSVGLVPSLFDLSNKVSDERNYFVIGLVTPSP